MNSRRITREERLSMEADPFVENVDKIAKAVYVIGDAVRIDRTPDAAGKADEAP